MDRKEAIDILVGVIETHSEEENDALDLAIEALSETPTKTPTKTPTNSDECKEHKSKLYIPLNQYTVERINRLHKNACGDYFDEEWLYNELEQIAEIFPVTHDKRTETHGVCSDCISREKILEHAYMRDGVMSVSVDAIKLEPSVTPTERTGKWIPCTKEGLALTELMRREGKKWYGYRCTNCNFIYKGNALTESRYCQGCGAKMGGAE